MPWSILHRHFASMDRCGCSQSTIKPRRRGVGGGTQKIDRVKGPDWSQTPAMKEYHPEWLGYVPLAQITR